MANLSDKINEISAQLAAALKTAKSAQEIEQVRIAFMGKKGRIPALFSELAALSPDEKRLAGPALNELKITAEVSVKEALERLAQAAREAGNAKAEHFDVTGYTPGKPLGHLHPYTQIIAEIEDIFVSMGYEVLDGPEVETDYYNFTALNIPRDHPARDMYDTFWLNSPGMLLRTHTSSVQGHTMENRKLPIAGIVPGRCFRHEATDASHDIMFMQCEGFLIDKNVTLSHLFGTAQTFLKALFNKDEIDIRIRPGFFPFVEPGVEIDMQCPFCTGGCSVCKKSTWIEIFPGGLIHPSVLKASGIDPNEYSGFAFGFGLTRLAMIKYGINDIRNFHTGSMKFLEQF